MRKLLLISCFLFLPVITGAEWLPNFEDVPMMDRTAVVEEEGFVYSRPDGRIVQATVVSDKVTRRQFQRFYSDALKELGWRRTHNTNQLQTFIRGADELNIEIVTISPLEARFTLTPK